ncbi:hypothetical protein PMAYCL1PPCAC_10914 [Pristionchus mayeri]|uniref:Tyrosine-protein kinase ephrin type A/B receptor-like domain-containing protein n=1 Tax=Pristionchus mayeri TaxID=1317129 RepID=A0AAN4ZIZ8_9BILA|nr:hypothetical protein PMAYCL1PPCAC_10914 [Pristionchus mayeri]
MEIMSIASDFSVEQCEKCPGNFTTMFDGATSKADCYVSCKPGYFTTMVNRSTCYPCGIGSYEDQEGALDRCKSCNGLATLQEASTSQSDCVNPCLEPGQELDPSGTCNACPRGTYKEATQFRCDGICADGLSTADVGSTSRSDCTVIDCPENSIVTDDTSLPTPKSFSIDLYRPSCNCSAANESNVLPTLQSIPRRGKFQQL